MPTKPLPDKVLLRTVEAYRNAKGATTEVARALKLGESTVRWRIQQAKDRGLLDAPEDKAGQFDLPALPDEEMPTRELLEHRSKRFAKLRTAKEARRLMPVKVLVSGAFGVAHFGDPHVDDDGTNIIALQEHVALVGRTEALFAGNVGDTTNNWTGRLARLYAQQSTSAKQAWQLAEWLFTSMRWLYAIGGNHDLWSGAGDPLKWIARISDSLYEPSGVRMALTTPAGRTIRLNARHDFKGHSMWNTAHGPAKAAQMGWRDHVLTCGHMHTSGYQVLRDPATRLVSHAIRVGSYKTYDRYAEEQGLPDQNIFCCPVTVVQPQYGDDDPRLITTLFHPEQGADFLTFIRRRKTGR